MTATRVVLLTILIWGAFASPANAYIDPGSTSMVFQALIAFAMAAGLVLKTFWRRIVSLFKGSAKDGDDHDA